MTHPAARRRPGRTCGSSQAASSCRRTCSPKASRRRLRHGLWHRLRGGPCPCLRSARLQAVRGSEAAVQTEVLSPPKCAAAEAGPTTKKGTGGFVIRVQRKCLRQTFDFVGARFDDFCRKRPAFRGRRFSVRSWSTNCNAPGLSPETARAVLASLSVAMLYHSSVSSNSCSSRRG